MHFYFFFAIFIDVKNGFDFLFPFFLFFFWKNNFDLKLFFYFFKNKRVFKKNKRGLKIKYLKNYSELKFNL